MVGRQASRQKAGKQAKVRPGTDMVHRFELATLRIARGEMATAHGYYVTPGNVAGIHRGATGVNIGGENRGDRERQMGGRRGRERRDC